MSTSIHWQPVDSTWLETNGSASTVAQVLDRTFGEIPLVLTEKHLDKLDALAIAYEVERPDLSNPYRALWEAVSEHGRIRVWTQS